MDSDINAMDVLLLIEELTVQLNQVNDEIARFPRSDELMFPSYLQLKSIALSTRIRLHQQEALLAMLINGQTKVEP